MLMRDISIFKKIKLFREYKKTLKKISDELGLKFNIRLDRSYRMYTVVNVPEDLIGESYSIKKSDIDMISESYIKKFTSELSEYLNSNGLSELFEFYKIEKIMGHKFSYLLIFGFSQFKNDVYYNYLYIISLILTIITIVASTKLLFF